MYGAPVPRWALLLCLSSACASAVPALSGGSTTPKARTDLAVGGAARVPTGALRDPEGVALHEAADAGGIVPVAVFRRGLSRRLDLGVMVAGAVGRLELRGEVGTREGSTRPTWVWAAAPYVGGIPDRDGSGRGVRFGLDAPFVRAIDFGGVYDLWVGPRVGLEGVRGRFRGAREDKSQGWQLSLRAGAVVGLAAGFRRVHALIELTVAWEQQWGELQGTDLGRGGLVLLPAFGLRVRI